MDSQLMLMIPGPTPVPEPVRLAMAKYTIGHRTQEFEALVAELREQLKWLHQTQNEVLIMASSGTGAMEAGMINFLSAGDRILVGNNGKFGDRWAKVAQAYGLTVEQVTAEWGKPLNPEAFRAYLKADTSPQIKAVVVTHSETSTGVLNDLQTISSYVKAYGALMMVDAVTSLGSTPVPMDAWGLDVVASGSQKGYMLPPGLGFIAVSEQAWKAYKTATLPKFYLDLGKYHKAQAKNTTPFTPPVNLFYGLKVALDMLQKEGLENVFARHQRQMNATRAAMRAMGLPLLAADETASSAITAVAPVGVDAEQIRTLMKQRYGILLAGGQDHLKGQIFRVGHLGFVGDRDILTVVSALEATLLELGYAQFEKGTGVAAAATILMTA